MTRPTASILYLNRLDHEDKVFIKIWYKSNSAIGQKIKTAAWIRYSKTYRCFVMAHTQEALQKTYRHFAGIAILNTRYLFRPKRLAPAEGATVLSDCASSIALAKVPERPVIRLVPVQHQEKEMISLVFKYDREIHKLLKQSKVCTWYPACQSFLLPPENSHLNTLFKEVKNSAQLWLCQTLRIKDIPLLLKL